MYNLCCKSGKATKLFFRKDIPEAVAGLLEEMRKAPDEAYYHPQVTVCRGRLHWSQGAMTVVLIVGKKSEMTSLASSKGLGENASRGRWENYTP